MSRLPFQSLQQRSLLDLLGKGEAHGLGPPGADHALRPVLDALQRDVLGGVAGAHQQQRLALELARVAEVVSVEDTAGEPDNQR